MVSMISLQAMLVIAFAGLIVIEIALVQGVPVKTDGSDTLDYMADATRVRKRGKEGPSKETIKYLKRRSRLTAKYGLDIDGLLVKTDGSDTLDYMADAARVRKRGKEGLSKETIQYLKRRSRLTAKYGLDIDGLPVQTDGSDTLDYMADATRVRKRGKEGPSKETIKYLKRRSRLTAKYGLDIDGFLETYGYLALPYKYSTSTSGTSDITIHSRYDRKDAIRLFQEFFDLKATGKLNAKTINLMKTPRCGLPDLRLDDPGSPLRRFHFYRYYPRWRTSILTWRASKYTKKISPLALWKTLKKAFETWSTVSGLRFLYTRQTPDIQVDFEHGNHEDGNEISFDEEGGSVAHAFGPGIYTISGDIHLDEDERWTQSVKPRDGLNIMAVTIHEIGHALGLHHSRNPRSVMYPVFNRTNLDLNIEDVMNIQLMYGPNPEMNYEPMRIEEPTTPAPKFCKIPMDDIDLGPDEYTYIFKNSRLRQLDKRGKMVYTKEKTRIWDVYENGPPRVDAVAFLEEKKQTYMFYNNTLWRYTNFDLDRGYPKNISKMPETPKAGVFIRDQYGVTRLLLYGSTDFWEWSTSRNQVMAGYPLPTAKYFEGLPKAPNAAIRYTDGYVYFIKRDKVYKVHPGSYKVLPGYPQPMPPSWITDKSLC